jgi:hypothetical protein
MLNWFKGKKKEETPVVNKTEESEEVITKNKKIL